jgi:hypothetical protein
MARCPSVNYRTGNKESMKIWPLSLGSSKSKLLAGLFA